MLNKVGGQGTFQRKTSWSSHLIWTGFQVHGRNSRVIPEFLNPKCRIRDFPGGPVVKTLLSLQGAWVLSVTGELRSHAPIWHSQKKKTKTKPKQQQQKEHNRKKKSQSIELKIMIKELGRSWEVSYELRLCNLPSQQLSWVSCIILAPLKEVSAFLSPIYSSPGRGLCLDSWSVSPARWVLRDQVTHFIITETETSGRWNLRQINSGKPVLWGKK